jgi:MATE family multidrug resistance protein
VNEFKKLWALAMPICITQIAFVAMGVVDTIIAGPMGAEALAGLALGNTIYFGILIFGKGLLMSLDTWVSQAYGGGRDDEVAAGLAQGLWLAAAVTPFLLLGMWAVIPTLEWVGYNPVLCRVAAAYLGPLMWGVLPALLFGAYRSALAAVDITRPVMFVALAANVVNYGLDRWFIVGGFGIDPMGVEGLAWSTTGCRLVLFIPTALIWTLGVGKRFGTLLRLPDPRILAALAAIGVPVGLQYLLEVWCFSGATILMGAKGEVPLAAHQIALNVASLMFMVPLGISSAAAVRCGQTLGAGDTEGVKRAGWTAFGSGLGVAIVAASMLALFAVPITGVYEPPPEVAALAVSLLGIAAVFQLVDATQAIGVGVLRGLGDTRFPLGVVVFGYGAIGLPVGYWLAFVASDDPRGLWWGLVAGLTTVAVVLLLRFRWLLGRLPTAVGTPQKAAESPWE